MRRRCKPGRSGFSEMIAPVADIGFGFERWDLEGAGSICEGTRTGSWMRVDAVRAGRVFEVAGVVMVALSFLASSRLSGFFPSFCLCSVAGSLPGSSLRLVEPRFMIDIWAELIKLWLGVSRDNSEELSR